MLTKEQAMTHDHFHNGECRRTVGPRGGVFTSIIGVRRNGKTKTWVTRPDEFRVPIKYGLRDCFYITQNDAVDYHIPAECPLLKT